MQSSAPQLRARSLRLWQRFHFRLTLMYGGVVLLLFEAVFTVTDPPLRALRRFIPPVRIGAVAFDLAILVLFIGTQVLIAVVSGLARA